ncbi:Hypothetical protein NTJ_05232 [Nesidiocoris tenuis]|nr:Hypothetical protein NTJ_05232 [Nesidiocoris tenuis]
MPANVRGRKRKSDTAIRAAPCAKRNSGGSSHNSPDAKSEPEIELMVCRGPIPRPKPAIKFKRTPVVETIILDDDSDTDSTAASVDSGTEAFRLTLDGPPIIEIEDSDSESVDSAISVSSPHSLLSAPVSPSALHCQEAVRKITDQQSITTTPPTALPAKPLGNTQLPARAHVITVQQTTNCDKIQGKNHDKTNQNFSTLKRWGVQRKTSPPLRHQKKKSPILKENTAVCEKKNQENVDNNNLVAPAQKTTCAYSLACLSPGVGYIPLLEFGMNTIKFEDPFGSGKVKMYANVMHATKWLNSEVQGRVNFDACTELKWTVVNAVILQAKRLNRFDFRALSQPNCRITKNGVSFS